jgi:hypothetical protein
VSVPVGDRLTDPGEFSEIEAAIGNVYERPGSKPVKKVILEQDTHHHFVMTRSNHFTHFLNSSQELRLPSPSGKRAAH